ncbi:MAG: DUF4129 domain-containing protein [Solobacterium sp.]|nr:DUF4129 domain-containing protein [Solobacterium sp.]
MRSFPALRLGGQVFCCIAVLSLFAPFSSDLKFLSFLAIGILAVSFPAVRASRKPLRIFLALFPAAVFMHPASLPGRIAGAAILLYAAAILVRGEFYPDSSTYRKEAACILAVCGLFAILSFHACSMASLCLVLTAALLVLLALRMLRAEGSMGLSWSFLSIGMLAAVIAAGAVLGVVFWYLRLVPVSLVALLAAGAGFLLYIIMSLVTWGIRMIIYLTGYEETPGTDGLPDLFPAEEWTYTPPGTAQDNPDFHPAAFDMPWMAVLTIAVIVLLVLAAVWLLNSDIFQRQKFRIQNAEGTVIRKKRQKQKKRRKEDTDSRSRIRYIYRRYLDYLRARGVKIDAARTTEEITAASSELFLHTDEQLRSLYRKARYSREPVTEEEMNTAQRLYDSLVAEENQRRNAGPPS